MKRFKNITVKEISLLICDGCGEQAAIDDYIFNEFICISHSCGYGSIHGDGNQLNIDLCQQCFSGMCGDILTVTEPDDEKYNDIRVAVSDILLANKIANNEELTTALKRVEQLWDAQFNSTEGNELHQLADLICAYEGKSWDLYFNEVELASDDFMPERLNFKAKPVFNDFMEERENIIEPKGAASGVLSDVKVNKYVDTNESLQDCVDEENSGLNIKQVYKIAPESKVKMLETLARTWTEYPDLRLTQLIVNAINPKSPCAEIFYVEDNVLLEKLKRLQDKFSHK